FVRGFEVQLRRKDGRRIWISSNMRAVRDTEGKLLFYEGINEDITARKLAEESLRHSEERFRQVVEHIREVFWMTDPQKNEVLYVSPAYEEIWGRPCASVYASPQAWLEAIHPEDRARVQEAALTKQARGQYHETYRIVRPNGSVRWIEAR